MASPGEQLGADLDVFVDFAACDDRPTFILDAPSGHIRFRNAAFNSHVLETTDETCVQAWVHDFNLITAATINDVDLIDLGAFAYEQWLAKGLGKNRFAVFCSRRPRQRQRKPANSCPKQEQWQGREREREQEQEQDQEQEREQKEGQEQEPEQRLQDMSMGWLQPSNDPWMGFIRAYAFEDTALGPISRWSPRLRQTVSTLMTCPEPRIMYWGGDLIMLYNEAAVPVVGEKHPSCLGNPLLEGWGRDVYGQIRQSIVAVMNHGKASQASNVQFILERHGFPEEAWFSFHQLPLTSSEGHFLGCVCEFVETTSAFIQENRSAVLDTSLKAASSAGNLCQLWSDVLNVIERESLDIVYGVVYTLDSSDQFRLDTSFGVPDIAIGTAPDSYLASVLKSPLSVLQSERINLPLELAINVPMRGTVNSAVIIPIVDLDRHHVASLALGLNPRRPFDETCRSFVGTLGDLLQNSATFICIPEEQRRNQEATSALSHQLQVALLKAEKNEDTFARMARDAPIGMYLLRPDGSPIFANDAYISLLGTTREEFFKRAETGYFWDGIIAAEDIDLISDVWSSAILHKKGTQVEFRVKAPTRLSPEGVRWLESTSFAELDDVGNLISIQGWLVDVSSRKLTEQLTAEKLQDALETKRASESFMDMVSHEIRNPLSSILQLADGIMTLPTPEKTGQPPALSAEAIDSIVDAAQTITLCASHQKNVIDEVLTLSKLDSDLLVLSLEKARLPNIINTALKMFQMELTHSKIQASMHVEQSYRDLAVDYVLADPSRLLQVVINLLTNAIKFTRNAKTRHISVNVAASLTKPTEKAFGIEFVARQKSGARVSLSSTTGDSSGFKSWNANEDVYLYVGIKDTGRGLSEDDRMVMFQRFQQGSPKTYKSYGGSGLGLFISRKLTELMNGQIGVKSESGVGSTFAFFIRAKRTEPPEDDACSTSIAAVAASTEVASLPHKDGFPDVKIMTRSSSCPRSTLTAKDLHVLVVEDNAINQKVIVQQLRRLGVNEVHVAEHGAEALTFLSTTTFIRSSGPESTPLSLILLDVEMPVMDGLTCVKRIREMEVSGEISRHVPVIAITANARSEQIATALEAGMDEVVTKPFRIPELLPRMEALVQEHLRPD